MAEQAISDVYDVAVIGFGPSGAAAAGLLASFGLRTYVCDRSNEVYDKPRAISLDHEILRIFQQIGVVDKVQEFIEPFTPSEYLGVDGQLIKRLTMVAPPYPMGYTPSNVFTQPPVEAALRQHVSASPFVTTDLGTQLVSIEQDGQGVTLGLKSAGGEPESVRALYAIACDGASSFVRGAVGIELEDLEFDEPWLVVDVVVNDSGLAKLPATSVQYCEPSRPATLVIGPGNHRRWEISLKNDEDLKQVATPEATWKHLARWIEPADGVLWRQASYRFHALVAAEWRRGRIFIAGDAAHQQPPFLGQGMCQGMRDVANLSWKLHAVLKQGVDGQRADDLLDSYGIERGRHVRDLTATIKAIGEVICERDVQRARQRDRELLSLCDGKVKDTPRQDVLPRLHTGFLSGVSTSPRGSLFPQPRIDCADGVVRLLDELTGAVWRLVLAAEGASDLNAPATGSECPLAVDLSREGWREKDAIVSRWFEKHGCRAALVRPDHYVFGVAATKQELEALLVEWKTWRLASVASC